MMEGFRTRTRLIALEEHYATSAFIEASEHELRYQTKMEPGRTAPGPSLIERLYDLGDLRTEEMDAAAVDVQVLSLISPGVQQMEPAEAVAIARQQNDFLAEKMKYFPDRFAAFSALPTPDPEQAAKELERTVNQFGFKGAAIMGHTNGLYLDDESFRPLLESAAALRVPLYLHPTRPPRKVIEAYYTGSFPPNVATRLATMAWGGHIDTAIHALRLAASGVFDRFPDLQIVIGHLGESIPSMLSRIDQFLPNTETYLERSIGTCFRENFHYTLSGCHSVPTFLDLLLQVGIDRIMFAADYPFSSMSTAGAFLDQLPVSPADKDRIAHGNAERLLQI